MGLFTNRKRNEEDLAGLSEAASMLAQFNAPGETDTSDEAEFAEFADVETPVESFADVAAATEPLPPPPPTGFTASAPTADFAPLPPIDDTTAAPIADIPAFTPFAPLAADAAPLAADAAPLTTDAAPLTTDAAPLTTDAAPLILADDVAPLPARRRLQDRPRAQAGNIEIDARGLLDMLGVDATSGLIDISEAHQRFLADHEPVDTDDADAAGIKEKIRCEVNTAYASFRLTHTA